MAKLIVIEGIDGAGKQTQAEMLYNALSENYKVLKLSFPNYDSDSSVFIKKYLNGDYGLYDNIYATSTFFAIDRYLTLREVNFTLYDFIICDRYTQSNMIHQGAKLLDEPEKRKYIAWLKEYEYKKLKIPEPDFIFYLYLPLDTALERISNREKKHENGDIHEENQEYMKTVSVNAKEIAESENWNIIDCENKSKEEIHKNILNILHEKG